MHQIPGLSKFPKLFHSFSTKTDGNMANSILGKVVNFNEVLKNREKFLSGIGADMNKSVCMWVTHGDEIIEAPSEKIGVSMKDYKKAVKVDGMLTNKKGIFLFLLIADCLPIILFDPLNEAIGLIHAGWKGVDLEIVKKAVKIMNKEYGSDSENIIVGIGPCAQKESYVKFDPDQKNDPKWKPFLELVGNDKYKIDLIGLTKKHLIEAGIEAGNIFVSKIDTVSDKRFFSHVREASLPIEKQGRFACVVGLR